EEALRRIGPERLVELAEQRLVRHDQQPLAARQYLFADAGQHPFQRQGCEMVEVDLHRALRRPRITLRNSRRRSGRAGPRRSRSSLANMPAYSWPSEMIIAPVSVARSTIVSGLYLRCAQLIASHSTRRPSASVLITSIVWPDMDVTTSPGRCALPSGMFSTRPQMPTTFALAFRPAKVSIAPATAPAPPMSHFIASIPAAGLIEMPPVSKVTPLPTKTSGLPPASPPFQRIARSRAGCSEPSETPSRAPMPTSRIASSSSTPNSTPRGSIRFLQRS